MNSKLKQYKNEDKDLVNIKFSNISDKNMKYLDALKELTKEIYSHINENNDEINEKLLKNLRQNYKHFIEYVIENNLIDIISDKILSSNDIDEKKKENIENIVERVFDIADKNKYEQTIKTSTINNIHSEFTSLFKQFSIKTTSINKNIFSTIDKSNKLILSLNSSLTNKTIAKNVISNFSTTKLASIKTENKKSIITRSLSSIKGFSKKTGKFLIGGLNILKKSIISVGKSIFKIGAFILKSITSAVLFITKLVISLISGILGVVFKIITGILSFALKVLTFAFKIVLGVVKIVSFVAIKIVSFVFNKLKSITKFVVDKTSKILKLSFTVSKGIVSKIIKFLILFKPFWFFLGYIFGRLAKFFAPWIEKARSIADWIVEKKNNIVETVSTVSENIDMQRIKGIGNSIINYFRNPGELFNDIFNNFISPAADFVWDKSVLGFTAILHSFDAIRDGFKDFVGNKLAAVGGAAVGTIIGYAVGGPITGAIFGVLGATIAGSIKRLMGNVWENRRLKNIAPAYNYTEQLIKQYGWYNASSMISENVIGGKTAVSSISHSAHHQLNSMGFRTADNEAGFSEDDFISSNNREKSIASIIEILNNQDYNESFSHEYNQFISPKTERISNSTSLNNRFIASMREKSQHIKFRDKDGDLIDIDMKDEDWDQQMIKAIRNDPRNDPKNSEYQDFRKTIVDLFLDNIKDEDLKEALINNLDIYHGVFGGSSGNSVEHVFDYALRYSFYYYFIHSLLNSYRNKLLENPLYESYVNSPLLMSLYESSENEIINKLLTANSFYRIKDDSKTFGWAISSTGDRRWESVMDRPGYVGRSDSTNLIHNDIKHRIDAFKTLIERINKDPDSTFNMLINNDIFDSIKDKAYLFKDISMNLKEYVQQFGSSNAIISYLIDKLISDPSKQTFLDNLNGIDNNLKERFYQGYILYLLHNNIIESDANAKIIPGVKILDDILKGKINPYLSNFAENFPVEKDLLLMFSNKLDLSYMTDALNLNDPLLKKYDFSGSDLEDLRSLDYNADETERLLENQLMKILEDSEITDEESEKLKELRRVFTPEVVDKIIEQIMRKRKTGDTSFIVENRIAIMNDLKNLGFNITGISDSSESEESSSPGVHSDNSEK